MSSNDVIKLTPPPKKHHVLISWFSLRFKHVHFLGGGGGSSPSPLFNWFVLFQNKTNMPISSPLEECFPCILIFDSYWRPTKQWEGGGYLSPFGFYVHDPPPLFFYRVVINISLAFTYYMYHLSPHVKYAAINSQKLFQFLFKDAILGKTTIHVISTGAWKYFILLHLKIVQFLSCVHN